MRCVGGRVKLENLVLRKAVDKGRLPPSMEDVSRVGLLSEKSKKLWWVTSLRFIWEVGELWHWWRYGDEDTWVK